MKKTIIKRLNIAKYQENPAVRWTGYAFLLMGLLLTIYGLQIYLAGPTGSGAHAFLYNYKRAFGGIKIALMGWTLILLSLLFRNPLNKIVSSIVYAVRFPGMDEYYTSKKRSMPNSAISGLWIPTFLGIFAYSYLVYLTDWGRYSHTIYQSVWEDFAIRLSLYLLIFAIVLTLTWWISLILRSSINSFLVWFFGIRKGRLEYDPQLDELQNKIYNKEMVSLLSLTVYLIYGIFIVIFIKLYEYQTSPEVWFWIFVFFCLPFFILLFGYNFSLSMYKASEKLNLEYRIVMKKQEFLISAHLFSSFWAAIMYVIVTAQFLKISLGPLFEVLVGSDSNPAFKSISEIDAFYGQFPVVRDFLEYILGGWLVYIIFFSGVFIVLIYYYFSSSKFEEKRKRYLIDILIFVFILISVQIPLFLYTETASLFSFSISFVTALTADTMRRSIDTMIKL